MELDKNLIGGSTRLLLLALLDEGDRYGYDIIRTLAERSQNVFAFRDADPRRAGLGVTWEEVAP